MNTSPAWAVDVSIVMPCLNEVRSLPHCIANAKAALAEIMERYSLTGEIVIADTIGSAFSKPLRKRARSGLPRMSCW